MRWSGERVFGGEDFLFLDFAGALDECAEEDFGETVYGGYYCWGDGLGEGLVDDLGDMISV